MPHTSRRTFMKAGFGTMGLAGMGLAGLPLAGAEASSTLKGLTPLYLKNKQTSVSGAKALSSLSSVPSESVRALRRLCFGYVPQDLTDFEGLGDSFDQRLLSYISSQLDGYQAGYPPTNDPPLSAIVNQPEFNFETLGDSLQKLWQERVLPETVDPYRNFPVLETRVYTLIRAIYSKWQLAEVLADFWHTHFSVDGSQFEVSPVFVHYDRDVIRANMLGNFRQMLESVTKSNAMMYYLDNVSNAVFGPNENFARELQELHSLGAENSFGFTPEIDIPLVAALPGSSASLPEGLKAGYSEQDVRQATLCLTGWTINTEFVGELNTGEFFYESGWHDNSSKKLLGIDITSSGEDEAQQLLDLLAVHPNTARYVCKKLCRRLIKDNPPESIVEKAAIVFNDQWQAPDQLKQVVKTIILSDEFKAVGNWRSKTKRPFELIAGTARTCGGFTVPLVMPDMDDWLINLQKGIDYNFSQELYWMWTDTGHMLFSWTTPDGIPDNQSAWLGATPLIMSWRVLNSLFISWYPDDPEDPDNSDWHTFMPIDAVSKTKNALLPEQRSARNIVNYWVNRFLGYDSADISSPQLDAAISSQLIAFMQQDANDADVVLDLDLDGENDSSSMAFVAQRVQTLVASIGMLPDNLLR